MRLSLCCYHRAFDISYAIGLYVVRCLLFTESPRVIGFFLMVMPFSAFHFMFSFFDLSRFCSVWLRVDFVASRRRVLMARPNISVAGGVPVVMCGVAR